MRELLATTEAKVLLAIDEYNELFQPSQWHYMDDKASKVIPGGRRGTDLAEGEGGKSYFYLGMGEVYLGSL